MRLNSQILANENKVDKDKAENYIIVYLLN